MVTDDSLPKCTHFTILLEIPAIPDYSIMFERVYNTPDSTLRGKILVCAPRILLSKGLIDFHESVVQVTFSNSKNLVR